jgi:hypothetical protein
MVSDMDDIETILARSNRLMDEGDRLLAQPRAEVTWTPSTYKSFDTEQMEKHLDAIEANVSKRFAAIDARFNEHTSKINRMFDALAEEAGMAHGELRAKK